MPDYRGLFLRGVNGNRKSIFRDSDASARIGMNRVGSLQKNELKSHTHDVMTPRIHRDNQPHPGPLHFFAVLNGDDKYQESKSYGGSETRPNNVYVNYIIYAGLD